MEMYHVYHVQKAISCGAMRTYDYLRSLLPIAFKS